MERWLATGQGGAQVIRNGRIALVGALICFLVFFSSVASGAAGLGALFDDVPEMLTLFVAVFLFVAGVLMLEAAEKNGIDTPTPIDPREDLS